MKRLGDEPVPGGRLVEAILETHQHDYGGGEASAVEVTWPDTGARLMATEWLAEVARLFLPDAFGDLHGRAVILGVALVDPVSGRVMVESGLFAALAQELKPPLLESLGPAGLERLALNPLAGFVVGVDGVTLTEDGG